MLMNPIRFFISLGLIGPNLLCIVIFFLQFLKPQPYAINDGLLKIFVGQFGLEYVPELKQLR